MNISSATKICMIIGDPVSHSLSPPLHNAAYDALTPQLDYVFVAAQVASKDLAVVMQTVRAMSIRGVTCTAPHKLAVIKHLDVIDPIAREIGAVNTVVNDNGVLTGYNTDWIGIVKPLEKFGSLKGKKIVIVGAGGAARAAAYGVTAAGANLQILNRTDNKARNLASEFGAQALSISELNQLQDAEIIINTAPLEDNGDDLSISTLLNQLNDSHILFNIVYGPTAGKLMDGAASKSVTVIDGREMLLYQALPQFKLYTGHNAPEAAMRAVIARERP